MTATVCPRPWGRTRTAAPPWPKEAPGRAGLRSGTLPEPLPADGPPVTGVIRRSLSSSVGSHFRIDGMSSCRHGPIRSEPQLSPPPLGRPYVCLLYTSDAADEEDSVDL